MGRKAGIRIGFGPFFKATQIEMLILQCVGQFVGHDRFLPLELDPVSKIKLLSFRVIIAGYLFGE